MHAAWQGISNVRSNSVRPDPFQFLSGAYISPGSLCLHQDRQRSSIVQGPAQQWARPDVYALNSSICSAHIVLCSHKGIFPGRARYLHRFRLYT